MDLDDQLAALAAGELDRAEARALEARVVADPALARRLARLGRLDEVLTAWQPPAMTDDEVARLDVVVDDALARLDDGPLADRATPVVATPIAADEPTADAAPVDPMAAARARRVERAARLDREETAARRGLPGWVGGLAIAAVAAAVVGSGALLTGAVDSPGSTDAEILADDGGRDGEDGDSGDEMAEAIEEMDADAAAGSSAALLPPVVLDGLELDDDGLAALAVGLEDQLALYAEQAAERVRTTGTDDTGGGDPATDGSAAAEDTAQPATSGEALDCLATLLGDRPGAGVALIGEGTYEGTPAVVVVFSRLDDGTVTATTVAASLVDCTVLDEVEATPAG